MVGLAHYNGVRRRRWVKVSVLCALIRVHLVDKSLVQICALALVSAATECYVLVASSSFKSVPWVVFFHARDTECDG